MTVSEAISKLVSEVDDYDITLTSYLRPKLGEALLQQIGWNPDWASSRETRKNIRTAFQAWQIITDKDSDNTGRAWFIGMNPILNDKAPILAIAEGKHLDVMEAAISFYQTS